VFNPTRFLPRAPAPDRFAFLPFGVGPRVCIDPPLAMNEATLALAEMARRYRIALANDRPVLAVGIVTPSRDGASSSALTHVDRRAPKRAEGDASRNRRRHDDRAR